MIRRHTPLAILSLVVTLGLAACGASEKPRWSQPDAASVTPSSKPLPNPSTTAEVKARVALGLLDLATFHPEAASPTEDSFEARKLTHPCVDALRSDRLRTAYSERLWDGENIWIRQYIVGYLKVPGRKLLDELRTAMKKCKSYVHSDGRKIVVIMPDPPLVPDNPDIVTYCERLESDSDVHQCSALLARGNFVMEVDASDGPDLKPAQEMLVKLIPLADEAFKKIA